jgi:hypothetical protein
MPVGYCLENMPAKLLSKFHHPFLMARGAKMATLA